MRFRVHVTPKSRVNAVAVEGSGGDATIKVRVTAAPEDGKANDALIALLAERIDVPRRAVRVVGGATSRLKWIEVEGLEEDELWRRLGRDR